MASCVVASPFGNLCLTCQEHGVTGIDMTDAPLLPPREPLLIACAEQLAAYFAGDLRCFDLPLAPSGTSFQQKVWQALTEIPYGETRSYGDIARQIGRPQACRAVGGANHRNPILIVVPCHRVVGADGSLTGYGCGLDVKAWLLAHEKKYASKASI